MDMVAAALFAVLASPSLQVWAAPGPSLSLGKTEAVSGTQLRVMPLGKPQWQRVRLFALQESTQPRVRRSAFVFAREWSRNSNKLSDSIKAQVYSVDAKGVAAADISYTFSWGNGASPEDRWHEENHLWSELLARGLAKLNARELTELEPTIQKELRGMEANAKANKLGMWR